MHEFSVKEKSGILVSDALNLCLKYTKVGSMHRMHAPGLHSWISPGTDVHVLLHFLSIRCTEVTQRNSSVSTTSRKNNKCQ